MEAVQPACNPDRFPSWPRQQLYAPFSQLIQAKHRVERGNVFPRLSSPKGFPSASDYLWLELVSCQPSGPVWRLCSLLNPQWDWGRKVGRDKISSTPPSSGNGES
ncbi:hypothetical protein CRENBAI_009896 [Crenichthys baileyi]|uniref:Uncharacterized protein n=1 Tax=Crenichthys baileyi TaxID=28760 RepID=A0AAV9QTJ3_9TELE